MYLISLPPSPWSRKMSLFLIRVPGFFALMRSWGSWLQIFVRKPPWPLSWHSRRLLVPLSLLWSFIPLQLLPPLRLPVSASRSLHLRDVIPALPGFTSRFPFLPKPLPVLLRGSRVFGHRAYVPWQLLWLVICLSAGQLWKADMRTLGLWRLLHLSSVLASTVKGSIPFVRYSSNSIKGRMLQRDIQALFEKGGS